MGACGQLPLPARAASSGSRARTTWSGCAPGLLRLAEPHRPSGRAGATDDAGAIFLAEHGDDLRQWFLFPDPPRDLPRRVAGKYSLYELCRELGVPCPQAAVPGVADGGVRVRGRRGLPADRQADHPVESRRRRAAQHLDRGRRRASSTTSTGPAPRAGTGLMLQEFIPGGPGQDWFFHGYCDGDVGVQAGLHRRQGTVLPGARRADQPRAVDSEPAAARRDHRAARAARLPGDPRPRPALGRPGRPVQAAGLQPQDRRAVPAFPRRRRHRRGDGLLPRPDRPADSGERTGDRAPASWWRTTTRSARSATGAAASSGCRSWLASLRTVDETAWFARDDLRPFGLMCLRMGWRMATRPLALPQGRASSTRLPLLRWPRRGQSQPGRAGARSRSPRCRPRGHTEPRSPKEGTKV